MSAIRGEDVCTCPEWTAVVEEVLGWRVGGTMTQEDLMRVLEDSIEHNTNILAELAIWMAMYPEDTVSSPSLAFWQDYWADKEDRPDAGSIGDSIMELRSCSSRSEALLLHFRTTCPRTVALHDEGLIFLHMRGRSSEGGAT